MPGSEHSSTSNKTTWTIEDDRYKKHEAIWKQTCSRTHSLWCNCGNWTSHIHKTQWCATTGDGDAGRGNRDGIDGDVAGPSTGENTAGEDAKR
nr:ORF2 [Torque teno felis virus]